MLWMVHLVEVDQLVIMRGEGVEGTLEVTSTKVSLLNQAVAGRTFPVTMETPGTRRHEHEKKEMVTLLFALTVPDWLKLIVECKRDQ